MKRLATLSLLLVSLFSLIGISIAGPATAASTCLSDGEGDKVHVGPTYIDVCGNWFWSGISPVTSQWTLSYGIYSVTSYDVYSLITELPSNNSQYCGNIRLNRHCSTAFILPSSSSDYVRYKLEYTEPDGDKCIGYAWQNRYTFTHQDDLFPCTQ